MLVKANQGVLAVFSRGESSAVSFGIFARDAQVSTTGDFFSAQKSAHDLSFGVRCHLDAHGCCMEHISCKHGMLGDLNE